MPQQAGSTFLVDTMQVGHLSHFWVYRVLSLTTAILFCGGSRQRPCFQCMQQSSLSLLAEGRVARGVVPELQQHLVSGFLWDGLLATCALLSVGKDTLGSTDSYRSCLLPCSVVFLTCPLAACADTKKRIGAGVTSF